MLTRTWTKREGKGARERVRRRNKMQIVVKAVRKVERKRRDEHIHLHAEKREGS